MKRWLIAALFPIGVFAALFGWRIWHGTAESRQPALGIGLMALGAVLAVSSLFILPRRMR